MVTELLSSPAPQRRRYGYGRPPPRGPPPRYGQSANTGFNLGSLVPYKVAGLAGGAAGFGLAQVLGK